MAIVPSGRRRTMMAQRYDSPHEVGPDAVDMGDVTSDQLRLPQQEVPAEDPDQGVASSDSSLSKFIFQFLEGLGYPGRRLQQYKSEFVVEKGGGDGNIQVTVTLPDQVYGKDTVIPRSKLNEFVNAVNSKFGLHLNDYVRKNQKVEMNFSSEDVSTEDTVMNQDILDDVFGRRDGPGSGSDSNLSAAAETLPEMLKMSKSGLVELLLDIKEYK
jgi:hypothetical protein